MKIKIFVLVFVGVLIIGCRQGDVSQSRREKLIKAIQSKDWDICQRAIMELGRNVSSDSSVQKILVQHLFSEDVDPYREEFFELVKALSKSDSSITNRVIRAYTNSDEEEKYKLKRLLYVLGRIGPEAEGAIPLLLRELDKNKGEPETEGAIRVVLANIGYKSDENVATILSDIKSRNDRSKSEIEVLAYIEPKEWFNEVFIEVCNKWLKDETRKGDVIENVRENVKVEAVVISVILGTLHSIDEPTLERMEAFFNSNCLTGCDTDWSCAWFGFVLAKVEPSKSQEFLKPALKCLACNSPHPALQTGGTLVIDDLIVSDKNMMQGIVGMLDDSDPNVVEGSLWSLYSMGLDAQEYAPKVMKILENYSDNSTRWIASYVIGYLASPEDIPTLEKILIKEKKNGYGTSDTERAIRILRLEKGPKEF